LPREYYKSDHKGIKSNSVEMIIFTQGNTT